MSNDKNVVKRLDLSGKAFLKKGDMDASTLNMMNNPAYLRQSSALINEALQKGFDVLQLANGDIVATGVKTVVNQYTWDAEQGKLVKTKSPTKLTSSELKKMREEADDEDADASLGLEEEV